ncbi:MAG: hypothetical protein ABIL16_02725 [candidate division WOR-3 bacterium]
MGVRVPPAPLLVSFDKHKNLLKLFREFRDNEEKYDKVLKEFENFLNLEEEPITYRAMAFDVLRTAALENPRDLRYEPYIRRLVEKLLRFKTLRKHLIYDFEYLFGEYFYSEHIYPIALIFWNTLNELGAYDSLERIKKEILSSRVEDWINRAKDMGIL